MQSSRTLREAMTKKGRCSVVTGNGPLTFLGNWMLSRMPLFTL